MKVKLLLFSLFIGLCITQSIEPAARFAKATKAALLSPSFLLGSSATIGAYWYAEKTLSDYTEQLPDADEYTTNFLQNYAVNTCKLKQRPIIKIEPYS